jgi:hypothetical protein
MSDEYTDAMSLRSLWENADINGGTVDVSGVGPNYRAELVAYLRELADRIELAQGGIPA